MNQIVNSQSTLFLTSIEIGILMGVLFDLIRVFRKLLKHPDFLVQIEDMLYWVTCGFGGFYMLYICNYAAIRPYIFIGIILGAIFYFSTFSVVFMKIATIVIDYIRGFIKVLIRQLLKWLIIPLKNCLKVVATWMGIPVQYISEKWHHSLYINKLRYRQYKRKKYEQKSDKKVENYLKKSRT